MKKTMIFAAAAMAMASAFADFSFAYLDTEAAPKDLTPPNDSAYTAYLCTVAAAETYFGGNGDYAGITDWLKESAANYATGMAALKTGDNTTAMSLDDFDLGVYTFYAPFKQSGEGSLADGNYIAVVAYADGADNMFRVFESMASDGTMAFKLTTEGGKAGEWTAAAVPEPTSGMLFLLGLASLALRRKRGEG